MVEIIFDYNHIQTIIQANLDDSFNSVIQKFINKTQLDINNIYFISNGNIISKNEKIINIMNNEEKINNKKIILVLSINSTINNGSIIFFGKCLADNNKNYIFILADDIMFEDSIYKVICNCKDSRKGYEYLNMKYNAQKIYDILNSNLQKYLISADDFKKDCKCSFNGWNKIFRLPVYDLEIYNRIVDFLKHAQYELDIDRNFGLCFVDQQLEIQFNDLLLEILK